MIEYRRWTVKHRVGQRIIEVEAIGYDQRGIYGVPITADGIAVDVELIRQGGYPSSNQFVSLTRPTEKELEVLKSVGWKWDGVYASKIQTA